MKSNLLIGTFHIVISVAYLVMFIFSIGLASPYLSLAFFIFILAIGTLHLLDLGPRMASYFLNGISLIYLLAGIIFLGNYFLYAIFLLEVITISLLVYFERKIIKSKGAKSSPMDLPVYG
ncbi:MAG: hypothetical protein JRN61_05510 [Nitrososphaerota archaeon]|nr:hypothetical protein [Nitrososphaerota archaeon]